jgi:hypothetical protein
MTTEEWDDLPCFNPGLPDEEVHQMNLDEWERVPIEFYSIDDLWDKIILEAYESDTYTLGGYLKEFFYPPVRIPK